MFSVSVRTGSRIRRRMSPASTKGRWTTTFTFSQRRPSAVSFSFVLVFEMTGVHVHPRGSLSFSRPFGAGLDHTLWPLISLFLSFSCSHCVFSAIIPLPPHPAYFLLSALISLADISTENSQKKREKPATLDWINTCTGSTDRTSTQQ